MQQRRPRLGDILDDYCPRERRITNHVIVAMIEDEVKQTRCSTCDADHEYKQARVPPPRRRKEPLVEHAPEETTSTETFVEDTHVEEVPLQAESVQEVQPPPPVAENDADEDHTEGPEDDGPVHRRLIRATLPRPEGQPPERKPPEFTRPGARRDLQREPSRRRWRTTSRSRTSRSPRRAELVQRSLALRDAETEFAARRTTRATATVLVPAAVSVADGRRVNLAAQDGNADAERLSD
jgi:hypothetical protein